MSLLTASIYLLCLAFLFGSATYIYSRDPFSQLNSSYAVLALSLLGWVGTLFVFGAQTGGPNLLWLGRANFAAAAIAAPAAWRFACAVARTPSPRTRLVWTMALLWAVVSLFTGWVDAAEAVRAGVHVTSYGFLFPLYAAYIVAFLCAALWVAFQPASRVPHKARPQLRLVGIGLLGTAIIGVTTNAVLPYLYGDFRFIHTGTLSVIIFLSAVSYAAVAHHLFNLRILLRKTLVLGLLIAFTLEVYQLSVEALTQLLPLGDASERHVAAATIALTINAFTHEPLHLWLEQTVDRLTAKSKRHPMRR